MHTDYRSRLDEAKSLPDIFERVKSLVLKSMSKSRGGLMLGMANLGNNPQGYFGGFFTTGSNVIVLNKIPLQRIMETRPELYKPYVFHVLLHEYIHSLGYLDEADVKQKVYKITKEALGEEHLATQIAADAKVFIKDLAYPGVSWKPEDEGLELVAGFDRSSVSYIS
ncbi:MAG: hypothetical protein LUQ15_05595 [Methanothrix sp.]|nr:hypothetical protein [Methanothrix sp.]OYV10972.1 MAG: hypothetical protein CG437_41 [Methanosaeta sp. NSP1]